MSYRYVVVGGGLQGGAIAFNLAERSDTRKVVVVDPRKPTLPRGHRRIEHLPIDVLKKRRPFADAASEGDACVVALPGAVADRLIPVVLAAGTPIVDISFTPEARDPAYDRVARRGRVPLIRDLGVAPGLSHILSAQAARELGGLDELTIYVGGMPQTVPRVTSASRFRHAVYFNAVDLMTEYLRPARMRRGGIEIAPDPLDAAETERLLDDDYGPLEAFPSDGLRSLLGSFPRCPSMSELTLRWPHHLEEMRRLSALGKLEGDPSGKTPIVRTASELARRYPGQKHPDLLLMEVHARRGRRKRSFRVVDKARGGLSAMARTTGFTAAAGAHILASRRFTEPGSHPPEVLGASAKLSSLVIRDLAKRNVNVRRRLALRPA